MLSPLLAQQINEEVMLYQQLKPKIIVPLLLLCLLTPLLWQGILPAAIVHADSATTPTPEEMQAEPLQLTFPAAANHPVSSWRPALFSIPFALGPHDHFYLDRPIAVTEVNWPLPDYRYGYQEAETDASHTGVDIDAPLHTPILAAGAGKVVFAGYGLALGGGNTADPYGLAVVIKHDFSFDGQSLMTVYAHMEKIEVKVGQSVTTGEEIGRVGITGNTTGPHVHFEVRLEKNNTYTVQNPELWMVPPTDSGVLVAQVKNNYGNSINGKTMVVKSLTSSQTWTVITYADINVRKDPYYQENLALSDLPAGEYEITCQYNYQTYHFDFSISPGAITPLTFSPKVGFALADLSDQTDDSFLLPVNQ
jgi:murein DD-endopeptidase MepM/ murein hydrolase activator NlpD